MCFTACLCSATAGPSKVSTLQARQLQAAGEDMKRASESSNKQIATMQSAESDLGVEAKNYQNAMTVAMIDAKRVVGDIANKLEIRAARNAGFEFTH